MKEKENIYIFGAGNGGVRAYNFYKNKYHIIGFIDNNEKLHGTTLLEKPIFGKHILSEGKFDHIIIASMYHKAIIEQLHHIIPHESKKILVCEKPVLEGKYESQTGCLFLTIIAISFYFSILTALLLTRL